VHDIQDNLYKILILVLAEEKNKEIKETADFPENLKLKLQENPHIYFSVRIGSLLLLLGFKGILSKET
jgi:hypothetical protein